MIQITKKTAWILLVSSTAFAATPATTPSTSVRTKAVSQASVQASKAQAQLDDSSDDVTTTDAQKNPTAPSSTLKQRTKLHPTVSASSPGYATALAKRNARASVATTLPSEPGLKAPTFGNFELKAQVRNTFDLARPSELEDVGGKNFDLTNEVRVGLKHKSGYGFSLTAAYQTSNFADSSGNASKSKDASVMLFHPSIFKNNTFDLYGNLRIYIPTSDASINNGTRSAAYMSNLDVTLAHRFSIANTMIARYFTQPNPGATDLTSVVYDSLELSHQTTKGIALAFGAQGEADNAYAAQSGTEVDLYPFIDFTVIPNVLIEPKYYFPVFVGRGGSVGASGAALNQTQAELFIKIAI